MIVFACFLALCAGVAAVGYGSILARFLKIQANLGDRGILGLLAIGFIGCVVHFFVALSTPVQVVVLVGGVGAVCLDRRQDRLSYWLAAGVCVFVLLHPLASSNFDNGLYYLQTFRWNHEFPLVWGIGNLHGRFAYNSILFLIAPLVDRFEIGWITTLLAATFVSLSLVARVRKAESGGVQHWFILLLVAIFAVQPQFVGAFGVFTSDSMAAVLALYWVALALGFSESDDPRTTFALLATSAVLAGMTKVSAMPLVALTAALGWINRRRINGARVWLLGAAVLMVWSVRGIALSGCAIFPVRQTCIVSLPWAVPTGRLADEILAIRAWARLPEHFDFANTVRDWSWFPVWFHGASEHRLMRLLLIGALLGAPSAFALWKRRKTGAGFVVIGLAASIAFWFFTAPDLRFGMGFLLAAGILGISFAGAAWLSRPRVMHYASWLVALMMTYSAVRGLVKLRAENFTYTIPTAGVYQVKANGLSLWVPIGGQCWAQALICTPYVDPDLLKRVRWPAAVPNPPLDPRFAPPEGWTPMRGVNQP